ncbi:MAG: HTTM domain-containing protein [Archangiaceae bacterium]|nr:HTTM domain-containing protein [Archangiaceae bacterium]
MLKARLLEPVHEQALPFFRRTYCVALAAITLSELWRMSDRYAVYSQYYGPIPPFAKLGVGLPPLPLAVAGGAALVVALLAAALGPARFERPALIAALLAYLFFFGTVLGWAKPHIGSDRPSDHHTLHVYVLVLLLVAPRGRAVAWPLLSVRAALAIAYLGAAYSKLDDSGFKWLDGYNLQTIFIEKYAMNPSLTLGAALGQSRTLCLIGSWLAIGFELSFWTVLLWPRRSKVRWVYVAAGLGFHLGTWVLMGIWQFVASFCAAYLVFFEWPLTRRAPMPTEPSPAPRGPPALAAAAVLIVMLAGALGRLHFWPLADFDTYSTYQDYRDQVDIIACEVLQADGSGKPCFGGTSAAVGAQILVRMQPGEAPPAAARRWVDEQTAQVPMAQRRMLIGRTLRLTLRSFPVVDGLITVKKEQVTVAQ